MISIRSPKGYDFSIQGAPQDIVEKAPFPATVGVLPERIPFIKPRLAVKSGDPVAIGDLLFTDKSDDRIRFLSPGGGHVEAIRFGPRRVIREVVIRCASEDEPAKSLTTPITLQEIDQCQRADLVEHLLKGGVWPLLQSLPFRAIADPEIQPPAIYVGLDAREPFQVPPRRYLAGRKALFEFGLRALRRLCPTVHVHADPADRDFCDAHQEVITHAVRGRYPAEDPGVVLFHIRRSSEDNPSWFINGQDVLLMAEMLETGRYPTNRLYAVAGTGVANPRYVASRLGAPLKSLIGEAACSRPRYALGGILRGYAGDPDGHMGFYETSVTVLPEPETGDFLTLFRPGLDKPTYSRTFLSALRRTPLAMTTNVNGGRRACIACGYCADVCPVDIWPQMTFKSILAEEVEEYLAHGLLDCVECGLCSYVCPSKIELAAVLRDAKHAYRKEQA